MKGLTRIRIGCIELGSLQPGEFRNLSRKEIEGLIEGKNTLVARKKFGAALKREKAARAKKNDGRSEK